MAPNPKEVLKEVLVDLMMVHGSQISTQAVTASTMEVVVSLTLVYPFSISVLRYHIAGGAGKGVGGGPVAGSGGPPAGSGGPPANVQPLPAPAGPGPMPKAGTPSGESDPIASEGPSAGGDIKEPAGSENAPAGEDTGSSEAPETAEVTRRDADFEFDDNSDNPDADIEARWATFDEDEITKRDDEANEDVDGDDFKDEDLTKRDEGDEENYDGQEFDD